MKKQVIVNLCGIQNKTGPDDPIKVTVPGEYYEENGIRYIKYEQYEEHSEEVSKNVIKIENDTVELTKDNGRSVRMYFEKNKRNATYYDLVEGSMIVETKTDNVEIVEDETTLKIELWYDLYMNRMFLSDCHVVIEVEEIEKSRDK